MKTYLIDLDGTMYRGNDNIDGAREFIAYLIENNQPFYFLTNNRLGRSSYRRAYGASWI